MYLRSVFALVCFCFALPQVALFGNTPTEAADAACAVAIQIVETECLPGDPETLSDDQFMVYTNVLGVEGAGSFISPPFYPEATPFATNIAFGPFSANDGPVTILVVDAENPNCVDEVIVEVPANCGGEDCSLEIEVLGTDGGPNGYYYTLLIESNGSNNGWTSNLGETGVYGESYTFGPFNCQSNGFNLEIIDNEFDNCSESIFLAPVDGCFSCDALGLSVNIEGTEFDDNDTPNDSSDDTYYVLAFVNATQSGVWSSSNGQQGTYGSLTTFGPFACGESIDLIITDEQNDCQLTVAFFPPDECQNFACQINFIEYDYVLDGDFYYIVTTVENFGSTSTLGWVWEHNGQTQIGQYGSPFTFGPFLCGDDFFIEVFDVEIDDCAGAVEGPTPPNCQTNCSIQIQDYNYVLDGPVYYIQTVIIANDGASTAWQSNTDQQGVYGETYNFGPFQCGQGFNLEVFDVANNNCFDEIEGPSPSNCNNNCGVALEVLGTTWTEEGFIAAVQIIGTGGSDTWTSNTENEGAFGTTFTFGPFDCSEPFDLEVFDNENEFCFAAVTLIPPAQCPGACNLELLEIEFVADGPVFYISAFVEGGSNVSTAWQSNTNQQGAYGDTYLFGPFPCGEDYNLEVFDVNNNSCFDFVGGATPDVCIVDQCAIQIEYLNEFVEAGNYYVQAIVFGSNTSGTWISSNNQTGAYGETVTFGPFNCDLAYDLEVSDSEISACSDLLFIDPPPNCGNNCQLEAVVVERICDDNNTPDILEDDTWSVLIAITGSGNNNGWNAPNHGYSGFNEYGTYLFGPFTFESNVETIFISQFESPDCGISVTAVAPEACGPACDINIEIIQINVDGDFYYVEAVIGGTNTSNIWYSNTGQTGGYNQQIGFGPFLCGEDVELEIFDEFNDECFDFVLLSSPAACSGEEFYDLRLDKVLLEPTTPPNPASLITYQLRLRNQGTIDADSVVVTDYPGEGLIFFQALHPNNVIVQPDLSFLVLGLDAGELIEIELIFQVDPLINTTSLINRAEITFDDGDDIDSDPDQGFDVNDLDDDLFDDDEDSVIIEDCCQSDPCDYLFAEIWTESQTPCGTVPDVNFLIGAQVGPYYLTIFDEANEVYSQDTFPVVTDTFFVLEDLPVGAYAFIIENEAGCEISYSWNQELSDWPGAEIAAVEVEPIGCTTPGGVFIAFEPDVDPTGFTYLWDNGATTRNLEGITDPGSYSLVITVPGGCTRTVTAFVPQVDGLFIELGFENPFPCAAENGVITVFTNPNQPPNLEYSYLWSNGETGQTIDGLSPGEYCVTVTASNGCSREECVTLVGELNLTVSGPTSLGCNGEPITLEAANIGEGFTYLWLDADGNTIDDDRIVIIEEAGAYTLVVTSIEDPNCSNELIYFVGQGDGMLSIELQFQHDNQDCGGAGTIFPIISGNINTPSTWFWTLPNGEIVNTQFIQLNNVTQAGTYTFTFTNEETGCTTVAGITLAPGTFGDCINVTGTLWADEGSCALEGTETPVPGWPVQIYNADNTLVTYVITDNNGNWSILLPPGEYFATPSPYQDELYTECEPPANFIVGNTVVHVDVLMPYVEECNIMYTHVSIPPLRICEERNIQVYYCNDGPVPAVDAQLEVIIDDLLEVEQVSMAPAAVFGQTYVFELGTLDAFECGTITFTIMVDCNATLGQSQCVEVTASPNEPCPTPDENWDGANVEVDVLCDQDEVTFRISNTGDNAMTVPLQYVVIEDVIMMLGSPNTGDPLPANSSQDLVFPADGSTYILQTNQEPGSPGALMPIASIEGCGTDEDGNFTTGVINQFQTSPSDQDWYSRVCRPINGSFDPNEKVGYPLGYSHDNLIEPGTQLTYDLYFQNTGNDFANRVVIVDTLALELDLNTVRVGAASHDFRYTLDSNRVLTFYFDNIMLPDSTTDLAGSQGMIQFTVEHTEGLPIGSVIENEVDIYFDFNAPIKTNRTRHQLGQDFLPTAVEEPLRDLPYWVVYPNPTDGQVRVDFPVQLTELNKVIVTVTDWLGRDLKRVSYNRGEWLSLAGLPSAAYVLRFQDEAGNVLGKADLIVR